MGWLQNISQGTFWIMQVSLFCFLIFATPKKFFLLGPKNELKMIKVHLGIGLWEQGRTGLLQHLVREAGGSPRSRCATLRALPPASYWR